MNYYWIDFWDDKTKQSKRNNCNIGKNIIAQYQQNRNNYNIKDNSFVVNLATALNMTKGSSNSFYIVLIPTSNNIAIRLRLSNHPSSSSEWVRHEINGVPNIRYSIWIGDFKGDDSHKIKKEPLTYVANGVKVVEYGYNKQFLNSNELRIDLFNTLQSIYNLTSISESKQIIRLTESDLHEIIKDAVYIIREQDSHVDKVIGNYNVIDGGWWDGLPHGLESKGMVQDVRMYDKRTNDDSFETIALFRRCDNLKYFYAQIVPVKGSKNTKWKPIRLNDVPDIIRKDIKTINPQGHEPYLRF